MKTKAKYLSVAAAALFIGMSASFGGINRFIYPAPNGQASEGPARQSQNHDGVRWLQDDQAAG